MDSKGSRSKGPGGIIECSCCVFCRAKGGKKNRRVSAREVSPRRVWAVALTRPHVTIDLGLPHGRKSYAPYLAGMKYFSHFRVFSSSRLLRVLVAYFVQKGEDNVLVTPFI